MSGPIQEAHNIACLGLIRVLASGELLEGGVLTSSIIVSFNGAHQRHIILALRSCRDDDFSSDRFRFGISKQLAQQASLALTALIFSRLRNQ